MVVPRIQECNKQVKGGKLVFTAKDIDEYSTSKLTVITYKTKTARRTAANPITLLFSPKQE
jgi:hypothetical protein